MGMVPFQPPPVHRAGHGPAFARWLKLPAAAHVTASNVSNVLHPTCCCRALASRGTVFLGPLTWEKFSADQSRNSGYAKTAEAPWGQARTSIHDPSLSLALTHSSLVSAWRKIPTFAQLRCRCRPSTGLCEAIWGVKWIQFREAGSVPVPDLGAGLLTVLISRQVSNTSSLYPKQIKNQFRTVFKL